jgi:hypothetical protein
MRGGENNCVIAYIYVFDAYMLALKHYQFITKEIEDIKKETMPDILTQLGQYCVIDRDTHDDEYLVRYYNHGFSKGFSNGFSKFVYCACKECREYLFSPFRLGDGGIMLKVYESTIDVIKERTNKKSIDYYEAVRIAI